MSRKKDLIRYTLRNERQLENCLRAIAEEFIKRQSDKTAKPLQIIGNPERKKRLQIRKVICSLCGTR